MPRHKREDYTCPRCGYKTPRKSCIMDHFYKLKAPCPGSCENIVLTDTIKDCVIVNRVYHAPKPLEQRVNTYHITTNIISKMSTLDKLLDFISYKQVDLMGIEDKIEKTYGYTVKKLESDGFKTGFSMKIDDLIDGIDSIVRLCDTCKNMEDFNIFYDKDCDKLSLYEGDQWEEMAFYKGVKVVLEKVQACFWYAYECYLLRHIYVGGKGGFYTARCREHLDQYFKFIGCFDIYPYLWQRPNKEILYNDGDPRQAGHTSPHMYEEYTLSDGYGARYIKVRDMTKRCEVAEIRKNVVDTIKNNSVKNTKELNRRVFELFQMDEEFKKGVMQKLEA